MSVSFCGSHVDLLFSVPVPVRPEAPSVSKHAGAAVGTDALKNKPKEAGGTFK